MQAIQNRHIHLNSLFSSSQDSHTRTPLPSYLHLKLGPATYGIKIGIILLFCWSLSLSDQQNKNTVLLFFALLTLKHVLHGEQKSLNHNFIQLYVALPCAIKDKCFRYYTRLLTRRCSEWRHCQQLTDANLVFSETKMSKCELFVYNNHNSIINWQVA